MFLQASSEYLFSQDYLQIYILLECNNKTDLNKPKPNDGEFSSITVYMILNHLLIFPESQFIHS